MNSEGGKAMVEGNERGEDGKQPRRIGTIGLGRATETVQLKAALNEAGFDVFNADPKDLGEADLYLVGVTRAADRALLADVVSRASESPVVAVASFSDTWDMAACLADGARGVLDAKGDPSDAVGIVEGAYNGVTCMPAEAISDAFSLVRSDASLPQLQPFEVELLAALVDGVSVAELAKRTHRSGRTMTRVLRDLYDAIGAGNRRQAVQWALRNRVERSETAHREDASSGH